jgi:hypothetical protein
MHPDETSHSQIAHPHAGSPWSFSLLHPLPQSLSLALSVWAASQQSPAPAFLHLVFLKKKEFFLFF